MQYYSVINISARGVVLALGKKRKKKKSYFTGTYMRTSPRENELGGLSCWPPTHPRAEAIYFYL
jgi:hypothetical protein